MERVRLYWSNICVLNKSEVIFLDRIKRELSKDGVDLDIKYFGLGYHCHMAEYLFDKDSDLPDMILSTDLEVFEDRRIFSRFEDSLYDASSWLQLKNTQPVKAISRDPRLLPYLAIPLMFFSKEKQIMSLYDAASSDIAFGGIDNSAAKSVVKTIWSLYGKEKAEELLRNASVLPMPIAAFQRTRLGQSHIGIIPSIFALSDDSFCSYIPEEGAIAVPSYIAVRKTISEEAAMKVVMALNSIDILSMYVEKGKMITAYKKSPEANWFERVNGSLALPSAEFLSRLDPEEFYSLYSKYIPCAKVLK